MSHNMNGEAISNVTDQKFQLDSSLKELEFEATKLFQILDSASDAIRNLEKSLQNISANFPFRYLILEEKKSPCKKPEPYHEGLEPAISGYYTQVYQYLAWEKDENCKNFRLLLTCEEVETVYFPHPESDYDIFRKFQTRCVSKKPVIETDLQTRLNLCKHLNFFISGFKEHLQTKRLEIESANELPF